MIDNTPTPSAVKVCIFCKESLPATLEFFYNCNHTRDRFHPRCKRCYHKPALPKPTVEERFWAKVDKSSGQGPEGTCWEWKAYRDPNGYGQFGIKHGKLINAHVLAYRLQYGDIPSGLVVMHSCDNPPCCNTDHLSVGTQADNLADMTAKGRRRSTGPKNPARGQRSGAYTKPESRTYGEKNGMSKLTAPQVREIRKLFAEGGYSQRKIARMFSVSHHQIGRICKGIDWKHIN